MRSRGRVDSNHSLIVRALRQAGASVQSLADLGRGCPDLLIGFRRQNYLFEVKDGNAKPSKRRLTKDESDWHQSWTGQVTVIESPEEALEFIGFSYTEAKRAVQRKETAF